VNALTKALTTPVNQLHDSRERLYGLLAVVAALLLVVPVPAPERPHRPAPLVTIEASQLEGVWLPLGVRDGSWITILDVPNRLWADQNNWARGPLAPLLGHQADLLAAADADAAVLHAWGWAHHHAHGGTLPPFGQLLADADSPLKAGDIVWKVNGAERPGALLVARDGDTVTVRRHGSDLDVTWEAGTRAEIAAIVPLVAPQLTLNLPRTMAGGSLGLAAALAYLDALTDGALTGGLRVAATGAIDWAGVERDTTATVGPVGGVATKLEGAHRAGADVVFLPQANNTPEIAQAARELGLHIVAVSTVEDAVAWLRDHHSRGPAR
jgi:hypothetical protein